MSERRRYTDEETRRILALASELELEAAADADRHAPGTATSSGVPSAEGRTLAEIRSIAEEAGIDPGMVDRAAGSLRTVRDSRQWSLLGAPTSFRFVHEVRGAVPYEEIPRVLDVLRRTRSDPPAPHPVAGGMEWSADQDRGVTRAAVVRKGDRTEIELFLGREAHTMHFLGTSALLLFLIAAVVGSLLEPGGLGVLVLAGAWLGATAITARAIAKWQARWIENTYQPVVDLMVETATTLANPYPPPSPSSSRESGGSTNR